MRSTSESIRNEFIQRQGEAAFEAVARLLAEVRGDTTQVVLAKVPAWIEFATWYSQIPLSSDLAKAFLWCNRHQTKLESIERPTIPPALSRIEDSQVLSELFKHCPFFLATNEIAFRCSTCFDTAVRLTELYASNPGDLIAFQDAVEAICRGPHFNRKKRDLRSEI